MHDLHVQETEKPATESETERDRAFRLENERRVVELQLLEGIAQIGDFDAFIRIESAVHHRNGRLVCAYGFGSRIVGLGDRVADVDVTERLDVRDHVTDATDCELFGLTHLGCEHADLNAFEHVLVRHRHESGARAQ